MKYYRIKYQDGRIETAAAANSLEVIKKYDLATRANIETRLVELSGEQLAIAISNDTDDEGNWQPANFINVGDGLA